MIESRYSEAGNVFIFILLGIVLFAALSFSMSRGFRTQGSSSLSDRKADLQATDIIDYGNRLERSVSRVLRKGCSINDITFAGAVTHLSTPSIFDNANSPADQSCHIFGAQSGGRLRSVDTRDLGFHVSPPYDWPWTNWFFHSRMAVSGIGNTLSRDLLANLPNINRETCLKINEKLNIDNPGGSPPRHNDGGPQGGPFTGSFPPDLGGTSSGLSLGNSNSPEVAGRRAFCVVTVGTPDTTEDRYHYFHVLYER